MRLIFFGGCVLLLFDTNKKSGALPRGVPADFAVKLHAKGGKVERVRKVDSPVQDDYGGMAEDDQSLLTLQQPSLVQLDDINNNNNDDDDGDKHRVADKINTTPNKGKKSGGRRRHRTEQHVVLTTKGEARLRTGLSDDEPSPPRFVRRTRSMVCLLSQFLAETLT